MSKPRVNNALRYSHKILRAALSPAEKRKLVKDTRFGVELDLGSREKDCGEGCLNEIARTPAGERPKVLAQTADRRSLSEAIIEKDLEFLES